MDRFPVLWWSCRKHLRFHDSVHRRCWIALWLFSLPSRLLDLGCILKLLCLRCSLKKGRSTLLGLKSLLRNPRGHRWLCSFVFEINCRILDSCWVHCAMVPDNLPSGLILCRCKCCRCNLLAPLARQWNERGLLRFELSYHLVIRLRSTRLKNALGCS